MARELLLIGLCAALAGGCKNEPGASAKATHASDSSAAASAPIDRSPAADRPPLASKSNFRIDAAPPACAAGKPCEVELRLTALGEYKVNKDYPFKFLPKEQAGLTVEDVAAFAHQGKQQGAFKVRFHADAAGPAQLAGVFKLSVCTEAECAIEEPEIALAVDVR
jgi:hypothetical protein